MESCCAASSNWNPAGIGARNLRECLLLQLRQLPSTTPWLNEALRLVSDYSTCSAAATTAN